MGEDLAAEGRMAVRTPMQWSATRNGGFSSAAPSRLVQAVVGDGYGPEHVNVMDQLHDPSSLLSWVRELIKIRHACPELGWGDLTVLEHDGGPAVLAHRLSLEQTAVIALHNLGPDPVTVTVPCDGFGEEPRVVDLRTHEVLDASTRAVSALEGYGVRWLRVRPAGDLAVP
jgi:glycosidase